MMQKQDFIDTAFITLAAHSDKGTEWAELYRDACEMWEARERGREQTSRTLEFKSAVDRGVRASAEHAQDMHAVVVYLAAHPNWRGARDELAALLGIPRDRTRRAVAELEARGILSHGADGRRHVTATVA